MTNLYFITFTAEDTGENFDLFVEAHDPDEAIAHWEEYYWQGEGASDVDPTVYKVPDQRKLGSLRWHQDIKEVPTTRHAVLTAMDAFGLKKEASLS